MAIFCSSKMRYYITVLLPRTQLASSHLLKVMVHLTNYYRYLLFEDKGKTIEITGLTHLIFFPKVYRKLL